MTKGGASAKRMKIAAKETDNTPTNRVMYGFTLITALNQLLVFSISPLYSLPSPCQPHHALYHGVILARFLKYGFVQMLYYSRHSQRMRPLGEDPWLRLPAERHVIIPLSSAIERITIVKVITRVFKQALGIWKTANLYRGEKHMNKIPMGPQTLIYPMPVLLIGANVDDKPNFMAAAWCGIANAEPPMISVAIRHTRYTLKGIRQNMTFSANVPSTDMAKETDYCGIASGSKINKAEVCQFKVFYGKLDNAPLVEQYPINLECKVVHILDLGSHSLIVGRIEETHISENCLTDGKPDVNKIKPLIYTTRPASEYQALGEVVAKAHDIGKELKARE